MTSRKILHLFAVMAILMTALIAMSASSFAATNDSPRKGDTAKYDHLGDEQGALFKVTIRGKDYVGTCISPDKKAGTGIGTVDRALTENSTDATNHNRQTARHAIYYAYKKGWFGSAASYANGGTRGVFAMRLVQTAYTGKNQGPNKKYQDDINDTIKKANNTSIPSYFKAWIIKNNNSHQNCIIWNNAGYGKLQIIKGHADPSKTGNLSLAGAVYYAYIDSACSEIAEDTKGNDAVLTTKADGTTNTVSLDVGIYYVKEMTPPPGFALDPNVYTVDIPSNINGNEADGFIVADPVVRRSVSLEPPQPLSFYISKHNLKGDSLPGSTYSVEFWGINSEHWVKTVASGERVDLYAGTVEIKEVKAPENYVLADGSVVFDVVQYDDGYYAKGLMATNARIGTPFTKGSIYVGSGGLNFASGDCVNLSFRSDLKFKKVDSSGKPLAGIPFLIESLDVDEQHVIVTDANGEFDSSKLAIGNANDYLLDDKGQVITDENGFVDESKLNDTVTPWFNRRDGEAGTITRGKFPYGKYRIRELKVKRNRNTNYDDIEAEFEVTADGAVIDLSTIENKYVPRIGTKAKNKETGDEVGNLRETTTIIDTVEYKGFEDYIGKDCYVTGVLMDKNSNSPLLDEKGKEITARTDFKPSDADGEVQVEFNLDSSLLAGRDIVVFEEAFLKPDTPIAEHKNLNDKDQTIRFAELKTNADRDPTGKEHKVIDEVDLKNLVEGKEYTIRGVLMDKKTEEPMKDEGGKEITAEKTFTATSEKMKVVLEFDVTNADIIGKVGVVFEKLFYKNIEIASHEDITDRKQTVEFPNPGYNMYKVRNEDAPSARNDKYGFVYGDKITYTVVIENTGNVDLSMDVTDEWNEPNYFSKPVVESVKGATKNSLSEDKNTVNITVRAGDTAKVVYSAIVQENVPEYVADAAKDSDSLKENKDCNRTDKDNTPDDNDGYVNVAKTTNVFYDDPKDPRNPKRDYPKPKEDEAQTPVQKPWIGTEAVDSKTNDHIALSGDEITVIDTVSYTGLQVGKEYTLKGEFKNKKDQTTVAVAETKFTPESSKGTAEVVFTFKSKGNKSFVAFEELYDINAVLVAEHKDINDEDQSVYIPEIRTIANKALFGVADEVKYKNLIPGRRYVIEGFLVNEKGDKLRGSDGSKEFTAKEPNGSVKVRLPIGFDLSRLAGQKLIAFERCYLLTEDGEKKLVALHEDLNDKKQTVVIPETPSTGEKAVIFGIGAVFVLGVAGFVISRRKKIKG